MKIVNPDGLDVERSWSVLSTTDAGQYRTICVDEKAARAECYQLNREPVTLRNLIVPPVDWSFPKR